MTGSVDPPHDRAAPAQPWDAPSIPSDQPPPGGKSRTGRFGARWRGLGRWTKVAVITFAVVVVLGIGYGAYNISGEQQRDYDNGHAAYLEGDCADAVGPLGEAADADDDEDLARTAQAELDECEELLAADALDTQGEAGSAVLSYSEFVTAYPSSAIVDLAISRGQALIRGEPAERIGSLPVCAELDTLEAQGFVDESDEAMPPLLLACGEAFEGEADFVNALTMFDRIRQSYPDHPLQNTASEAFVRATLAEADATGAGELPTPDAVGSGTGATGPALVVIRNASNEELTIVFSGPEQRVEEMAACTDCEAFSGDEPDGCPAGGPEARYEVEPGSYDVVVKAATESGIIPFRGNWTLDPGQEYAQCFYIVEE